MTGLPERGSDLPLVSVVIPAYNHQHLVERAIRSVLDQSYPRIELVVVDDGSTDGTWDAIRRTHAATGGRFRIHTKANQGVSATLNHGVRDTSGEYVAVLASDDYYAPGKIERQVALFARSPASVGLVHSSAYLDYGDGRAPVDMHGTFLPATGECFRSMLSMRARVIAPTAMFTREAYLAAGGFDESMVAEDVDFFVAVAARGFELAYDPAPLLYKTVSGSNLGAQVERWFDVHFRTLRKYADRLTPAEYAELEDGIYEHMGRISAGAGRLAVSWKAYSALARRTRSFMPYLDFAGRAARHVALAAVPTPVRHGLRAMRGASAG